jgi:hypothetical protein
MDEIDYPSLFPTSSKIVFAMYQKIEIAGGGSMLIGDVTHGHKYLQLPSSRFQI